MKKVFKKNQIIISALAIMIAIAGYLNFTKDKAQDLLNSNQAITGNTDLPGNNPDLDLVYSDISDEDNLRLENSFLLTDNGDLVLKENQEAMNDMNSNDVDASKDTSIPGEAILASTSLSSGFFSNAKLAREQVRSRNKQTLMDVIADNTVSDDQKQVAIDAIIQMTATAEMENATELLLEAKGFDGVVVNIVDGNIDVVVNAQYITDAQIAQIEDIVMRKTNSTLDKIVITSVVVEE